MILHGTGKNHNEEHSIKPKKYYHVSPLHYYRSECRTAANADVNSLEPRYRKKDWKACEHVRKLPHTWLDWMSELWIDHKPLDNQIHGSSPCEAVENPYLKHEIQCKGDACA